MATKGLKKKKEKKKKPVNNMQYNGDGPKGCAWERRRKLRDLAGNWVPEACKGFAGKNIPKGQGREGANEKRSEKESARHYWGSTLEEE